MSSRFESQSEPIPGYRLMERLGSGGFGEVWKCEAPGGIFKAVKIIFGDIRSKDADTNRFAEQEMKALKRVKMVRHPYLLALDRYDVVDGRLMIVMELADCNLWDRFRQYRKQGLPGIPREELLGYMFESAEVLDLMNDQFQLQHLDIKPQNLFLLYNHVKVADFGQVKDLEGVVASVTGGITPVYAAPETFDGVITRFCDQYSLACVYQELLTGQRPFTGTSMQQLLMQHLQMPPDLNPAPLSDRAALAKALAKKPEDRFPSVMAMVKAFRDGMTAEPLPPPTPYLATPTSLSGVIGVNMTQQPGPAGSERIEVRPDSPSQAAWPASPLSNPPFPPAQLPAPWPTAPTTFGGPPSGTHPQPTPQQSGAYSPPYTAPNQSGAYQVPVQPPITPISRVTETNFPSREAPPEEIGDGPIRPALVIGLGGTGLRVLQRLRKVIGGRFGPPLQTPALRLLYVDTDPDATAHAASAPPGFAALPPDDVFPTRLNRAGHYLKPRLNGRSLTEGWFDTQLLYKLPRTPTTMGVRAFGRLAFCDHYRALMLKVQAELNAAVEPAALSATQMHTGYDLRTNRPRVYVVAGLGGATGGGMFLDVAYSIRAKLARMGYEPDVVGLFLIPPDVPYGQGEPITLANTYAALTELHHYSRPETTFTAGYDDRAGHVRDMAPPFERTYLIPSAKQPASGVTSTAATSRSGVTGTQSHSRATGSSGVNGPRSRPSVPASQDISPDRNPAVVLAEYLRLELFSPVGRLADEIRPAVHIDLDRAVINLRTFGLIRFGWPRAEIVAKSGKVVVPAVVTPWVNLEAARSRGVVAQWVGDRWMKLGLDPEALTGRLTRAVDAAAGTATGGKVEELILSMTEPLIPKGWLARLPDPERVSVVADQLSKLVGRPGLAGKGPPTTAEQAVQASADQLRKQVVADLPRIVIDLIDDPGLRPAGAEDAVKQMTALSERLQTDYEQQADALEAAALTGYDLLSAYIHYQKGMRKTTAIEFTDALRNFPRQRLQVVVLRGAAGVYKAVRNALSDVGHEINMCRQRLAAVVPQMTPSAGPTPEQGSRDLLPPGCTSLDDSVQKFLHVLTDHDLLQLDGRIQAGLVHGFGGLYQACLNSTDGLAGVVRVVKEETRRFLDERLGEVDFAGMFGHKFGSGAASVQALTKAYQDAEPALVGAGPWSRAEVRVYAGPAGAGGDPLRELAARAMPQETAEAFVPDEAIVFREFPDVPLAALPQLGPQWAAAYRAANDAFQATAHTRADVQHWIDVDAG